MKINQLLFNYVNTIKFLCDNFDVSPDQSMKMIDNISNIQGGLENLLNNDSLKIEYDNEFYDCIDTNENEQNEYDSLKMIKSKIHNKNNFDEFTNDDDEYYKNIDINDLEDDDI